MKAKRAKSIFKRSDVVLCEWGGIRRLGLISDYQRTGFSIDGMDYEYYVELDGESDRWYCFYECCLKKITDNEMKQIEILL